MTTGRRARQARWRGGNARTRRRAAGSLARGVLVGLLALPVSGQGAAEESVTSPDPAVAMWLEIRDSDDRELLTAFVEAFPDSPYVHAARARLKRLEQRPRRARISHQGPRRRRQGAERAPVRKRRRSR